MDLDEYQGWKALYYVEAEEAEDEQEGGGHAPPVTARKTSTGKRLVTDSTEVRRWFNESH